jgi:hypothetical protein
MLRPEKSAVRQERFMAGCYVHFLFKSKEKAIGFGICCQPYCRPEAGLSPLPDGTTMIKSGVFSV